MEEMDSIYQSLDNHEIIMGIFLDLQDAFDTVNQYILLKILEIYGIRGIIISTKWTEWHACMHARRTHAHTHDDDS